MAVTTGDVTDWIGVDMTTVVERFWAKVDIGGPDECWEWTGALTSGGYGWFRQDETVGSVRAHRFSAMLHFDEFVKQLWVLHRCDNRACVNPAHLYLGTRQDNVDDMMNRRRHWAQSMTQCRSGHEFTSENTYINPVGARCCRECRRARSQAWWSRHHIGVG